MMIGRTSALAALLVLAACGSSGEGQSGGNLAALAENPPVGADDIDRMVEEERQADAASNAATAPGNSTTP